MPTLIVTAHPDTGSLTFRAAERVRELIDSDDTVVVHLAQEGFDPRFTPNDRAVYAGAGETDGAVAAEQHRLDAATDVVLVFPVYWWSMPALLKGWIDRVFIAGWAFGVDDAGKIVPLLGRLRMHLLPISGTAEESFARHGYAQSFSTQIEHGIVDYCGVRRGTTAFVWDSEGADTDRVAAEMDAAAASIARAVGSSISQ